MKTQNCRICSFQRPETSNPQCPVCSAYYATPTLKDYLSLAIVGIIGATFILAIAYTVVNYHPTI